MVWSAITRSVGLVGLFALMSPTASGAETCLEATRTCGANIASGCDVSGTACPAPSCPLPLAACRGGAIGPGACFDPQNYLCDLGRIRIRRWSTEPHSSG
jgi:hypothetical protein